jgi:hypothetical protein
MEVVGWLFWILLFAAWLAVTVWAIIHLRKRMHAPIWAVVLFAVVLVVVPFLAVGLYWLVIGVIVLIKRASTKAKEPQAGSHLSE